MFGNQQPVDVGLPEIFPEMPGLVTGDHEFFDAEHAFKLNTFGYFWYIYILYTHVVVCSYIICTLQPERLPGVNVPPS